MYKKKILEIAELFKTTNFDDLGLYTGGMGIALFNFYYSQITNQGEYYKIGSEKIEVLIDNINSIKSNTYCGGLAGVCWGFEHIIEKKFIDLDSYEFLEELDELLEKNMNYCYSSNNWDFLHGASGITYYFNKRYSNTKSLKIRKIIEDSLVFLDKITIKEANGRYKLESIVNIEKQEKGFNICLSHGISSIVCLLAKLYKNNIEKEKVKNLINGFVSYILAQQYSDIQNKESFFPSTSLETKKANDKSRLAWCYGDLGVAMAIYQAGIALNNSKWIDKAMKVFLFSSTKRDLKNNSLIDAGLCHGTAGVGHIFYRMYWNTKRIEFKVAADFWFNETLKMAYHEDGLAGFKAWHTDKYGGWVNEAGLLEGVAGIGLALMSYYYEIEPDWDECLLLS